MTRSHDQQTSHHALRLDQRVGRRLRLYRRMRKMSRADLAAAIGIRHQQLGKYERGQDRLSCGRLILAAAYLDVAPTALLEEIPRGLREANTHASPARIAEALKAMPPEWQELILDLVDLLYRSSPTPPRTSRGSTRS